MPDGISPDVLNRRTSQPAPDGTPLHRATLLPLLVGYTCGGCRNRIDRVVAGGKAVSKCALKPYRRRGPDVPPHTPACVMFADARSHDARAA